MPRIEIRRWSLWVHKESGFYCDPGTTPRLGGRPTHKSDYEWVNVKEERPRKKKKKQSGHSAQKNLNASKE